MVTTGALHAIGLILATYNPPGDRVLVEQPTYHGALSAIMTTGARPVPVALTDDGWGKRSPFRGASARTQPGLPGPRQPQSHGHDTFRGGSPTPRHHHRRNPDSHNRRRDDRRHAAGPAGACADGGLHAVSAGSGVDDRVSVEIVLGGLRVGWIRAERSTLATIATVRPSIDMGTAIVEQLAAARLFAKADELLAERRDILRHRRDSLRSLLREHLPDWSPIQSHGGMSSWCGCRRPQAPRCRRQLRGLAWWCRPVRVSASTARWSGSSECPDTAPTTAWPRRWSCWPAPGTVSPGHLRPTHARSRSSLSSVRRHGR